jgi:YidC/Oxa1 family membrane protein insertase
MEEKNFDLKSFIGFILIGAILLYMMYQNQPSPNDTSLNDQTNQEEVVNKISKNDPKQSSFNLNDAFKKRDVLNSFDQKKYVQSNTLLENELLAIEISNLGGMLSKVRLKILLIMIPFQ